MSPGHAGNSGNWVFVEGVGTSVIILYPVMQGLDERLRESRIALREEIAS